MSSPKSFFSWKICDKVLNDNSTRHIGYIPSPTITFSNLKHKSHDPIFSLLLSAAQEKLFFVRLVFCFRKCHRVLFIVWKKNKIKNISN